MRLQVPLQYQFVDTFFELVSILIANDRDYQYLDIGAELLFVFSVVRAPLLADRVPTFYSCYKSLYAKIAQSCGTEGDSRENIVVISAADKLEKYVSSKYRQWYDFR